jgi:voltage-gated potassium channel
VPPLRAMPLGGPSSPEARREARERLRAHMAEVAGASRMPLWQALA